MATNSNRVWVQQSAIDGARHQSSVSSIRSVRSSASSIPGRRPSTSSHAPSDAESVGSSTSHGRHMVWGWKEGFLVDTSASSVVVRLADGVISTQDDTTVRLGPNALKDGHILLSNDYPVDEDGYPQPPSDLITLTHLHEPSVVESLEHRYAMDQIYTATGPVLLALNPFQTVRGLYGESIMKKYWDKAERNLTGDLPPHVYSIADSSFRNMMRSLDDNLDTSDLSIKGNQSILVSGESGAGKTVTTKFVMKYLAALSQRSAVLHQPEKRAYVKVAESKKATAAPVSPCRNSPSGRAFQQPSWAVASKSNTAPSWNLKKTGNLSPSNHESLTSVTFLSGGTTNSIEAQVLQSNPILESFGNARTVRNDNSSRFGKFIEIQFTPIGKLVGAQIETYLLEKVRVVTQNAGERNYHVFYEVLSGAMDKRELSQFYLAPTATPQDFRITASGTYGRRDGVSDQETYKQLRAAMNTMKFVAEEVREVLTVVAAILHASNLTFVAMPGDESALDAANIHLPAVCELLGVLPEDLNQALCSFTIQAGKGNFVKRSLDRARAEKGLEALLKAVYGALFTYLVKRINDSISFKGGELPTDENEEPKAVDPMNCPAASIGVLDIFGFESFTVNSFEQMCINYCNEALQQQFNAFVLKNEQAVYEREGIEWSFIEFPENQDVLDLIEKRNGLLSILDDQCRAPGPSDKAFALDVYSKCTGQPRFEASRKHTATLAFSIHHYAGLVEYCTAGFTEKNRDELPKEASELLRTSDFAFVQDLAMIIEQSHDVPAESGSGSMAPKLLHRVDSSVARTTVGGQFRRQLRNLRNKIDVTTPHYVRCLKPNDMQVPDHFDRAIVAEQLRCGGILEAVRVARAGFTQHYPHADFVKRYRSLAWKELTKKEVGNQNSPASASSFGRNGSNSCGRNNTKSGRASFLPSYQPKPEPKLELSASEIKGFCTDLIKILYRKIQHLNKEDGNEVDVPSSPLESPSPVAKAKTYISQSNASPSWMKQKISTPNSLPPVPPPPLSSNSGSFKNRSSPWEKKSENKADFSSPAHVATATWKRGVTSSDWAKVGIQLGKTKVFLRHKAFEALERIRSREQTMAATKLNSIFRRYLARIAYIPYRDAFRMELTERFRMFDDGDFKESKEPEFVDGIYRDENDASYRFRAVMAFHRGGDFASTSLVDKWTESRIRDAIHNPVPRHEWGKQAPTSGNFKWVLSEGLWIRNYID